MGQDRRRGWRRWKFLLEVAVYAAAVIALTYGLKQFEGVNAGRVNSDVPSFFDIFK